MTSGGEVTRLLAELRGGNKRARAEFIPLADDDLHRMAPRSVRSERPNHTLQATALFHEAYLQLSKAQEANWQNRAHFPAVAATAMCSILVDHGRARSGEKHGGGQHKLSLDESLVFSEGRRGELPALDEELNKLAEFAPRESRVVERRHFGGLSVKQTAEVLQISAKTVKRDWKRAEDGCTAR